MTPQSLTKHRRPYDTAIQPILIFINCNFIFILYIVYADTCLIMSWKIFKGANLFLLVVAWHLSAKLI